MRNAQATATIERCLLVAALSMTADAFAQTPPPTPPPSPVPSPTPAAAAIQDIGVEVDGATRTVEIVTPSRAETGPALPLLVLLHGNGEGPTRWVTRGSPARADLLAEQQRIIIALPTGLAGRWDPVLGDQAVSPDVAYVAGLVAWMLTTYNVDPERVYVGGFSMGAVLAGRLACGHRDTFPGFLMGAGGDWGGACKPSQSVTVVAIHGTNDTTLPIQPAVDFTDAWRSLDGCSPEPSQVTLTTTATAITSTDCEAGTAVMFVRVQGANHRYFDDPDALRLAWQFFEDHQRQR